MSEWRPIESAPKTGKPIKLKAGGREFLAYWSTEFLNSAGRECGGWVAEEEDDAPAKGSKHGAAVSHFLQLALHGASANRGMHAAFPTMVPHIYLQVDNNDETCGICGGDGNAALCIGCFPRVPIGRITQPSR